MELGGCCLPPCHNLKGKARHSPFMAKAKHNPLPDPGGSPVQVGSVFINHHRFSFLIKKIHHRFWQACHAGRASKGTTEKARHSSSSSSTRLRWAGHTISKLVLIFVISFVLWQKQGARRTEVGWSAGRALRLPTRPGLDWG